MAGNGLTPKKVIATRADGKTYETTVHVRADDASATNFSVPNGGVPISATRPASPINDGEEPGRPAELMADSDGIREYKIDNSALNPDEDEDEDEDGVMLVVMHGEDHKTVKPSPGHVLVGLPSIQDEVSRDADLDNGNTVFAEASTALGADSEVLVTGSFNERWLSVPVEREEDAVVALRDVYEAWTRDWVRRE